MVIAASLLKTVGLIPFLGLLALALHGIGKLADGGRSAAPAWWVARPVLFTHHGVEKELAPTELVSELEVLGQEVEVSRLTGRKIGPLQNGGKHEELPVGEIAE